MWESGFFEILLRRKGIHSRLITFLPQISCGWIGNTPWEVKGTAQWRWKRFPYSRWKIDANLMLDGSVLSKFKANTPQNSTLKPSYSCGKCSLLISLHIVSCEQWKRVSHLVDNFQLSMKYSNITSSLHSNFLEKPIFLLWNFAFVAIIQWKKVWWIFDVSQWLTDILTDQRTQWWTE